MRIIGTMMVRDEIDIVAAMVEHHLAQGVDLLIVTDNASIDGTTEVLEEYARTGRVELHHDPLHLKQQSRVVTAMARRARTEHRADWVLNLDADEFLVPMDRSLTVRAALERTPLSLNAFTAPVTNLVGPPAWSGSGIGRLEWRDLRTDAQLQEIGIFAQPTPNAIHRGESDVVVAQGNHFVSLRSNGQPPADVALEVLHLPWRSWAQLERKVVNAGRSYENNPELRPSPNHHGMRDYRRYREGRLQAAYLARTPTRADLVEGASSGHYRHDDWLTGHLRALAEHALVPHLLHAVVDPENDHPVPDGEHVEGAAVGRAQLAAEEPVPARA
ncbi:glycosyltransferase family 2 protein [Nocardioides sp. BP30]|uniref:glycosyltransferase family 2 protein n=1 Tax=Nocardioides sp. BP30 TaxID=3036374 RepID=UPI0024698B97|nr:glycosyltransferase family 2 protein [Nocardioides sp. BP30]WGL53687.1 glycosyltransferase family 2 protein [Nocardioides sp. BP30]